CWYYKSDCNAPPSSGCNDDGVCTTKEPCYCADCATEPECEGYCISCRAFTNFFSTPDALCTDGSPSSADLWADLKSKACTGVCLTECGVTLCNDSAPSMECLECI